MPGQRRPIPTRCCDSAWRAAEPTEQDQAIGGQARPSPDDRERFAALVGAQLKALPGHLDSEGIDLLPAQLRERPDEASGLDIVWSGTSFEELLRSTATTSPAIIVADLDHLGDDPQAAIDTLLASSAAELVITVYKFAPRATVAHLLGENRRVVKAPVSIAMLKTHMMSTIVRGLLDESRKASTNPPPARLPMRARIAPRPIETMNGDVPLYTDAQLGTLRERSSRLSCECPNHMAELVTSLLAFERYSRSCANRGEDDATMHRTLARASADARRVMETALAELLRFENITV